MRIASATLAFLVVLGASMTSAADDGASAEDARAKQLFVDATAKLDRGDLDGALADYRAAYDLVPRAKILLNIGAVLLELGRSVEAANVFEDYLRREDADPNRAPAVRQRLAELDRKLGKISLDISATENRVTLDGADLGTSPLELLRRATPGKHTVVLTHPDGSRATYPVTVVAGSVHQLVVANNDAATPSREERSSPAPMPATRERRKRSRRLLARAWLWSGVVCAGALTSGIFLGLQSRSFEDDVRALNAESSMHAFAEAQVLEDKARTRALFANVSFVVAGAAAVATVVFAVRDRGSSNERGAWVSAAPTSSGGALVLGGTF